MLSVMRVLACAWLLSGCAASLPLVPPEHIGRAGTMPAGYERVASVVASCHALDGFGSIDGESLASFDCNRARLERVLAERASEESAEMLVTTRCGRQGSVLRCTAVAARAKAPRRVAAMSDGDPGPVPGPAVVARWDEPRASTSLVIRVDFEPTVGHFVRLKRAAADVAEVAALPVSHRGLGTLTTRCDAEECELRELRHALRVAAGGLGASDLVGVRCFGRGGARECVADLAATPLDE